MILPGPTKRMRGVCQVSRARNALVRRKSAPTSVDMAGKPEITRQ